MTLTVPQWLLRGIDSVCVQWEIDLLGKTICQKAMWCREQRKALTADPRVRINPILLRFVKLASPMSSHHFCPLLQKQGCGLNTAWCLKSLDPKEWSWVVFCGLLNFCCLHANAQMWTLCCGINLGSILAIWCWEWFCKALWAAEQHCSFLPTCLLCGGKKPLWMVAYSTYLCSLTWWGWESDLYVASWFQKSSLPELGDQYRLCNVPPTGPTTHPSPQHSGRSLDFRAEEADVKQHCPRCTGDSDDSSWEDGSWQQRELAVCEGHFCWYL